MTTKSYILEVFTDFPNLEWISRGTIEDRVRLVAKTKASGVARELRKMSENGTPLIKQKIKGYVEYKKVIV